MAFGCFVLAWNESQYTMQSPIKRNGLPLKTYFYLYLSLYCCCCCSKHRKCLWNTLFYSRGFATICSIWGAEKVEFGEKCAKEKSSRCNQFVVSLSSFRSFYLVTRRNGENFWSFILARLSEVFVHSAKLGRSLLIEKRVSSHSLSLRQEQDSQLESQEKRRITVNHSIADKNRWWHWANSSIYSVRQHINRFW